MSILPGEVRAFNRRETDPNREVPFILFLEKIADLKELNPADGNLSLVEVKALTKKDEELWDDLLVEVNALLKINEENVTELRNSFLEYKRRILSIEENVFVGWLSNLITPIALHFSAQELLRHSNDDIADQIFSEVLTLKERLKI